MFGHKTIHCLALVGVLSMASGTAIAQSAAAAPLAQDSNGADQTLISTTTAGSLTDSLGNTAMISTEAAKVNAQAELLQAKLKLLQLQSQLGTEGGNGPGGKPPSQADEPVPQLVAVFGMGKDLIASLRYSSGLRLDARRGDTIEDGWKVTSVTPAQVQMVKGGKAHTLRIYAGAGASGAPAPGRSVPQPAMMGSPMPGVMR